MDIDQLDSRLLLTAGLITVKKNIPGETSTITRRILLILSCNGPREVSFTIQAKKHLQHYLHEIGFRWNHRVPVKKKSAKGKEKIIMRPLIRIPFFRAE